MKILIADQSFPEWDVNAGALRMWEIVKILRHQGHDLTFLARQANKEAHYQEKLEDLGVQCACDSTLGLSESINSLVDFLKMGEFEAALLSHFHVYNHYAPFLRAYLPQCHLVLDTVDLHFLRLQREAVIYPERLSHAERTRCEETKAIADADSIWVVTPAEQESLLPLLQDGSTPISIIPTIHLVREETAGYADRHGIIFLGGYLHNPNTDAVHFFMSKIFPTLNQIKPGILVTIAGSHAPEDFREYEKTYPNVTVAGFVEDHRAVLNQHRVGIAPLRFGAGMKGKIAEYMGCGLPCVATKIGAEGMGLADGRELLVADTPEEFAAAVARIYQDQDLWNAISEAGKWFIQEHYTPEAIAPAIEAAMAASSSITKRSQAKFRIGSLQQVADPVQMRRRFGTLMTTLRIGGAPGLRKLMKAWMVKANQGV